MLYNEITNKYIKKKFINKNPLSEANLFFVREYGEYISVNLNIKNFSKFDFKGYIVMFVLDGSGIVKIDDHVLSLQFGDLLIFNSDSTHIISNHLWKVCYINIDGTHIYKMMSTLFKGKYLYHISQIDCIYKQFHSIFQSLDNDMVSSLKTCSDVLLLFSDIIKYDTPIKENDFFETKILNYLENHYMEDISIDDMAIYCGYSKYCFIRKFKEVFKETPYCYLKSKRIAYAKQLIKTNELSIHEIAQIVGFNSFSNFCVAFKNKEHMTPKEYQHRKNERDNLVQ